MLLFSVCDSKKFMNFLLKDCFFSEYETRGIILNIFTRFEINCLYDKSFQESPDEEEDDAPRYCKWRELQPVVINLIKGKKPPALLKIIFCISGDKAQTINENASSLYITIKYENANVNVLTGTSQRQFSLDKNVDTAWDSYVTQLFIQNGFTIKENDE